MPCSVKSWVGSLVTSPNEHGNRAPSSPGYTDRQHTIYDVIGLDIDSNGTIDSFFIDFNYFKRNTVINGVVAALTSLGPKVPVFDLILDGTGLVVLITDQKQYLNYRVGVRGIFSFTDLDRKSVV